jgi:hypothetical protein
MTPRVAPEKIIQLPLNIGGSNKFGRYPKISSERIYNMFMSDGWMVPMPGHQKVLEIDPLQEGRGLFVSSRGNFIVTVIGSGVYVIGPEIQKFGRSIPIGDISENIAIKVGEIETFSGDVFIDENDAEEIGICDKKDNYMYNYGANTFTKASLDFTPGYIAFQDGYFISPDLNRPQWRLSAINNGLSWPAAAQNVGSFQTKPDNVKACVRVPGKGNQLFVMGSTVTEPWNNVGYRLFPYVRTNSFNIDYGCVNQASIATLDKYVVWVGKNENSSPAIMISDGGPEKQISTDGINFALQNLTNPEDCYAFLWKSDGHLFYQATFRTDKVTYLYDIGEDKFYFFSDKNFDNHIAKKMVFFANDYYFISLIDGNLYRLSGDLKSYDGETIPRIIISNTIRLKDNAKFLAKLLNFTIEQGDSESENRVDVSISYDGGSVFGNVVGMDLNALAHRINKFTVRDMGMANEMTVQLRLWGDGRFLCKDGYIEVRHEDT